jgi:hypothetical protein
MDEKTTLTASPALVISLKSLKIFTGCKEAADELNVIRLRIIYYCGAKVVHPRGFANKQPLNIIEFLIIKIPIKNIRTNS